MNTVKVKFIKEASNYVKVELVDTQREMDVPKRVFEKRVDLGLYEIVNPSALATVI